MVIDQLLRKRTAIAAACARYKVARLDACGPALRHVGQTLVIDGGTTSWFSLCDSYRTSAPIQFGQGYVPGI